MEQKPSFDKRFALLIDADNVSSKYIKPILDELSKYGTITYKRIYGDWTSTLHAKWKDALLDNSITPIQQFSYTVGKNATDSAMIIDAMDILYTNSVEGFCLVSSDSDFTRLASRIRESGLTVIGMGEKKTPTPFRKACDIFTTLELLIGEARRGKGNGASSSLTVEEVERAVVDIITDNQNNGKSTGLGEVGSRLLKRYPDFDVRSFGTNLLSKLLSEFKSVTIRKDGSNVRVELTEGVEHEHATSEKAAGEKTPAVEAENTGERDDSQAEATRETEVGEGDAAEDAASHGSKSRRRRGRRRKSVKTQGSEQGESSSGKVEEGADEQRDSDDAPVSAPSEGGEEQPSNADAEMESKKEPDDKKTQKPNRSRKTRGSSSKKRNVADAALEDATDDASAGNSAGESAVAATEEGGGATDAVVDAPKEADAASSTSKVQTKVTETPDVPAPADATEAPEAERPKSPAKRRRGRPRKAVAAPATPDDFIRAEVANADEGGVAVAELAKRVRTRFKSFKVRELGYPHLAGYLADVEGVRVYKQGRENWVAKE